MWLVRQLLGPLRRFLERRRFPTLFMILTGLFGINLVIPDALPLVDELIMLVLTVLLGTLRKSPAKGHQGPPDPPSEAPDGHQ